MATTQLWTYSDALEHAFDYIGSSTDEAKTMRDCRRAVQAAYREFTNVRDWSYYKARYHQTTYAPYSTGTITYTNSTRAVALTGGTWPTWAAFGAIVISNVAYEVYTRDSNTQITLTPVSNPGSDVTSTTYTIYRDTFPLPVDFQSINHLVIADNGQCLNYVPPRQWIEIQKQSQTTGTPYLFTIRGDPNYVNVMALTLYPPPDQVFQLDGIYQRRPRQLITDRYYAGTATTTNGNVGITGSGTTWLARHAGAVIRFSSDTTNLPTGIAGGNMPALERTIAALNSATNLDIDTVADQTLTDVKYVISDPIDLEDGAMLEAFLRCVEKQLQAIRVMKDRADAVALYTDALQRAMEADARYTGPRSAYTSLEGYGRKLYTSTVTND